MDENPEVLQMEEHKQKRPGLMYTKKPPYQPGTTHLQISLIYKKTWYHVYVIIPFIFLYVAEPNISYD